MAVGIKGVRTCDLKALFNYTIGCSEVLVNTLADGCPTIFIFGPFALEFKVLENILPILLDRSDVAEECVALRFEDRRSQLTGRGGSGRGRVEGIEHSNTIGLVERLKAHFIDQGL